MKRILVSLLIVSLVSITAKAQKTPEFRKGRSRHHEAFQKLNLSEDQKAKFKSMHEDFRKQMQDLKKQDNITVKEWKARKEKLHQDRKEKMQSLLTADQKAQLQKMREDRLSQRQAHTQKRMEIMKRRLTLTDEQSKKLTDLQSEMSGKVKTLRENNSLTQDQKKDQIRDLMKERKEKMKSILTNEQFKKLKELKRERPGRKKVV